jgi:prepilin-type N-terminal cleavage/methylation domain-containing protein
MTGDKRRGFTIIELLVVAMIIALMAGATFTFGYLRYKTAVVGQTARKLMLAAKYARLIAVENQIRCKLVIIETDKKFFLIAGENIISNPYTKPTTFDDNVNFQSVAITRSSPDSEDSSKGQYVINFMPDGTADAAVMQITNGKTSYTVTISPATAKAKVYSGVQKNISVGVIDLDQDSNENLL